MKILSAFIYAGIFVGTLRAIIINTTTITTTTVDVEAVVSPSISQVPFDREFVHHKYFFLAGNKKYLVYDPVSEISGGITIFNGATAIGSLRLASMREIQN